MASQAFLGRGSRKRPFLPSALVALCLALLGVVTWRVPGSWASVRPGAHAAESEGEDGVSGCEALRHEHMKLVEPRLRKWEKATAEGRTILNYGNQATRLLNKTLVSFDRAVTAKLGKDVSCQEQREALSSMLQTQLHSFFLVQRSSIEQALYQNLKKNLLRKMRRKRRELNVKEKLRLLHSAMGEYDSQVGELLPAFVENSERDRAEKRLSELQWGIGDTPEAKEMQQRWKMERLRQMPTRQSKGVSVSLSPGLRLMLRPGGFGNFQLNSRRQVGPIHNPNEISLAVHNDGNVMDVYNKKPKPPFIKFQPTVGVDISAG